MDEDDAQGGRERRKRLACGDGERVTGDNGRVSARDGTDDDGSSHEIGREDGVGSACEDVGHDEAVIGGMLKLFARD